MFIILPRSGGTSHWLWAPPRDPVQFLVTMYLVPSSQRSVRSSSRGSDSLFWSEMLPALSTQTTYTCFKKKKQLKIVVIKERKSDIRDSWVIGVWCPFQWFVPKMFWVSGQGQLVGGTFFVLNSFMFKEPRTGQLTSFYPPREPPVCRITFTLWFPFRSVSLIFIKPSDIRSHWWCLRAGS